MDMLAKPKRGVPFRERMRQHMLVPPTRVAVRVEYLADHKMFIAFVCLPCESSVVADREAQTLLWDSAKQWFECPNCGLELLPDEADILVSDSADTLRSYRTDVTRKEMKRWPLARFFDRLFRRRPPSLT